MSSSSDSGNQPAMAQGPPPATGCPIHAEKRVRRGTLIVSLGNPLRHDDGVGAAVVQQLASMDCLPQGVELLDGGVSGLGLILLMQDYQRVILVDAADLGLQAGEWIRLPVGDSQAKWRWADRPMSCHIFGLAEALSFGKEMDLLPSEILFYGVQPEDTGWSSGLSARVRQAVPAICSNIAQVLTNTLETDMGTHGTESYQHGFEPLAVTISTAPYQQG